MGDKRVGLVWLLVLFILGAVLALVAVGLLRQTRPTPIIIQPPPPSPTPAPSATAAPLRVYVSGAVVHAAVYRLPAGSIVADAVEAAGNFRQDAATELVNLAEPLIDGMQIYVPSRNGQGQSLQPDVITIPNQDEPGDRSGRPVNINTADVQELDTLPGVGPATAQNIVEHRQLNGPFDRIESIMDVSGIGPAKFEAMKELITVD